MKIVVSGDWHLGLTLGSYDFFDDISEAINIFIDETQGADFAIVLGDVFHSNRPLPRDMAFIISSFLNVGCPTIVLSGNHDVGITPDFDSLAPLRKSLFYQEDIMFPIYPMKCCVNGVNIGLCGYVKDSAIRESDVKLDIKNAQDRVNRFFDDCCDSTLDYIFCHLDVDGSDLGGGAFMKGGSLQMPLKIAKSLPCDIFNGHIHKRQRIGKNIWMPGSLVPVSFGDVRHKKGFMVIER